MLALQRWLRMRLKILSNKIKCNFCGDVIESKHVHDFKTCKCGRVSVDGGHEYMRRCFKEDGDYEELSVTNLIDVVKEQIHEILSDYEAIQKIAVKKGLDELVDFMDENREEYFQIVNTSI